MGSRRFVASWARVFMPLLMIAGMMPVGMTAQQAAASGPETGQAQTSQAQTGQAKSEAANTESEKSSSEESNLYRHSATVQKLARLLNVDVETAAKGFELFNFLIIALGIGIPLGRMLPKMLRNRRASLSKSIEEARTATTDAKARLSAVEAKLANLDVEIAAFRAQVESESVGDEARIKATIEEERQRIVEAAGQEIGQAAAQAQRGLRQFAAELAVGRAVRDYGARSEADKDQADREMISQFARDFTEQANGGKN